jgi:hypothetical protein
MMRFPMHPLEVTQLYKLCLDSQANMMDCVEGYRLLIEFQNVMTRHYPELWDLSMKVVMDTSIILDGITVPFDTKHEVWNHPPIPQVFNGKFEK